MVAEVNVVEEEVAVLRVGVWCSKCEREAVDSVVERHLEDRVIVIVVMLVVVVEHVPKR